MSQMLPKSCCVGGPYLSCFIKLKSLIDIRSLLSFIFRSSFPTLWQHCNFPRHFLKNRISRFSIQIVEIKYAKVLKWYHSITIMATLSALKAREQNTSKSSV